MSNVKYFSFFSQNQNLKVKFFKSFFIVLKYIKFYNQLNKNFNKK